MIKENIKTINDFERIDCYCLYIYGSFLSEPIKITNDNKPCTIEHFGDGIVFEPAIFENPSIESNFNQPLEISLNIQTRNSLLLDLIDKYDKFIKANGIEGNELYIDLIPVRISDKYQTKAISSYSFIVNGFNSDLLSVTFNLSSKDLSFNSFPPRKMFYAHCSFKFKDKYCQYRGNENKCDKSIVTCQKLGNLEHFGGFVGLEANA